MNESKHTPGPWEILEYGNAITISKQCFLGHVEDVEGVSVAIMANSPTISVNYKTMRANAALIAAAPELLGAMKEFIAYEKHCEIPGFLSLAEKGKRLVLKAEGKEK